MPPDTHVENLLESTAISKDETIAESPLPEKLDVLIARSVVLGEAVDVLRSMLKTDMWIGTGELLVMPQVGTLSLSLVFAPDRVTRTSLPSIIQIVLQRLVEDASINASSLRSSVKLTSGSLSSSAPPTLTL
jgi:hypothetical protein